MNPFPSANADDLEFWGYNAPPSIYVRRGPPASGTFWNLALTTAVADPLTTINSQGPRAVGTTIQNLPAELRTMIWELLLPPTKTATVRPMETPVSSVRPDYISFWGPHKAFGIPIFAHLCAETRAYISSQGGLISFPIPPNNEDKVARRALWWNFSDTLVFDLYWMHNDNLLLNVTGLDNVKHITLTRAQASCLGYGVVHKRHQATWRWKTLYPQGSDHEDLRPLPTAIRLRFDGCMLNGVANMHFVPRFCTALHAITVDTNHRNLITEESEEEDQVTFRIDRPMAMAVALANVTRLKHLWERNGYWAVGHRDCDKDRKFVAGPMLAVEEGHVVQDRYDGGGEFFERFAVPRVIMGIRQPNMRRREILW